MHNHPRNTEKSVYKLLTKMRIFDAILICADETYAKFGCHNVKVSERKKLLRQKKNKIIQAIQRRSLHLQYLEWNETCSTGGFS